MGFGKGVCEVVGSISEETLDHRGTVSPGDGLDWEEEIPCFCECRIKSLLFSFYIFYFFILYIFDVGL